MYNNCKALRAGLVTYDELGHAKIIGPNKSIGDSVDNKSVDDNVCNKNYGAVLMNARNMMMQ